ncbi:SDR family NAD(P)-dependent oxidoreductase [Actinoplanes sp. NPDC051859]|uniref:SDR family NAD(P)-dependent oxidoreductase n=1 Tax=Actinoplanes sp. NPDC051859 TaxID=3363909 RepID=UPI003790F495
MTDNAPLAGRVALVTGANQGIGREIARTLCRQGAHVVVNHPDAHTEPAADSLPAGCLAIRADVRHRAEVTAMVDRIATGYGRLDILVNNAGIFPRASLADLDEETWDRVLDTNLKGAFLCAQQVAPLMIAGGVGGRIVNISSSAAFTGSVLGAHYAASKAGLIALGKSLARALADHRITVNTVAPGMVETTQPGLDEAGFAAKGRSVPLGRVGRPEDVAAVVGFLVSDASAYVTGQTLGVNGGKVLTP